MDAAPSGAVLRRVLHAGCGAERLPDSFGFGACNEVRLDICPEFSPDILANITDMGDIGLFDAAFSSHCLEHLYPAEVGVALGEFYRVIKPGGHLIIVVPDLEGVLPTEDVVYECLTGPITGLDMYYGHHGAIPSSPHMAHHCGFVKETLTRVLLAAGFDEVHTMPLPHIKSLIGIAKKHDRSEQLRHTA